MTSQERSREVDATYLKELFTLDPSTGVLRWKISRNRKVQIGRMAGGVKYQRGVPTYLQVKIDKKMYAVHRLVWLYVYGAWPTGQIDHIDGNGMNNAVENLRDVSASENKRNIGVQKNNSSGFKGVSWHKTNKRWQAYIKVHGRRHTIGYFATSQEAHAAYCKVAEQYHGEFARVA
jgi:hypothetical protein